MVELATQSMQNRVVGLAVPCSGYLLSAAVNRWVLVGTGWVPHDTLSGVMRVSGPGCTTGPLRPGPWSDRDIGAHDARPCIGFDLQHLICL